MYREANVVSNRKLKTYSTGTGLRLDRLVLSMHHVFTNLLVSHESDLVSTVAAISRQIDRKTISQALDGVATQQ